MIFLNFISIFMNGTFHFNARKESSVFYLIHLILSHGGQGAACPLGDFCALKPPSERGKEKNAIFPTVMRNLLHLWHKFLVHSAVILQYLCTFKLRYIWLVYWFSRRHFAIRFCKIMQFFKQLPPLFWKATVKVYILPLIYNPRKMATNICITKACRHCSHLHALCMFKKLHMYLEFLIGQFTALFHFYDIFIFLLGSKKTNKLPLRDQVSNAFKVGRKYEQFICAFNSMLIVHSTIQKKKLSKYKFLITL